MSTPCKAEHALSEALDRINDRRRDRPARNADRVAKAIKTVGDQRVGQMIFNAIDVAGITKPDDFEHFLFNVEDDALAEILEKYAKRS